MRVVACVVAVRNPANVKWDRFRQLLDVESAEPVLNPFDRPALELAARAAAASGATFECVSAGPGASAALREAAAFGASSLVCVDDPALADADEVAVARVLFAAIKARGGADLIACGSLGADFGSGCVPGLLAAMLDSEILVDVTQVPDAPASPLILAAAPYGVAVRAISPIALMRAGKKPVEPLSLEALGLGSVERGAAVDGPLESTRGRRAALVVEGDDPDARAVTLAAVLRERAAI